MLQLVGQKNTATKKQTEELQITEVECAEDDDTQKSKADSKVSRNSEENLSGAQNDNIDTGK